MKLRDPSSRGKVVRLGAFGVAGLFVFVTFSYLLLRPQAGAMATFEEVRGSYRKTEAALLDRRGEVVHEMRVDPNGRRLEWAPLQDVSPALIRAVLAAEDRKFYEHRGVDWAAFGGALREFFRLSNRRGASTMTMQLAS